MQAICILAHTNFEQVLILSKMLKVRFEVYIHFDKKMKLTQSEFQELDRLGVQYIQKIDVRWGSFSIGEAAIELFRLALANEDISYLHLISGQDWPCCNLNDIYNFFENNNKSFITYELSSKVVKSGERNDLWQKFFFNYDLINRRTLFGKVIHRILFYTQKILHVDKFKLYKLNYEIYSGANWCDITRETAEFAINFLDKDKKLYKALKTGFCADEFWLQTILLNSEYENKIINKNFRFNSWIKKYNSYPAILDLDDWKNIVSSGCYFVRKVDLNYSKELIAKLNDHFKNIR